MDIETTDEWDNDEEFNNSNDDDEGWDMDIGDSEDLWENNDNSVMNQNDVSKSINNYEVLNKDKIIELKNNLIQQSSELLFVSEDEVLSLLKHFGWNAKALENQWFNDEKAVRKRSGVSLNEMKSTETNNVSKVCQTAFCDDTNDGMTLACGHYFCGECWSGYLQSEVKMGRTCVMSTCPGMKCNEDHIHSFGCSCSEMVPSRVFKKYVHDEQVLNNYNQWVLDDFVKGNPKLRWCPGKECGRAIESVVGCQDVECVCGQSFCFHCSSEAHSPAPCDLVKKWNENDPTEVWLDARTKQCPKCGVRIEKNRACNHMTCTNCKHNFCWLCKGDWSKHGGSSGGWYRCDRYIEAVETNTASDEEKRIVANTKVLQKYTYYYQRFKESSKSIKLTRKRWEELEKKLAGEDYARYSFLYDAMEQLIKARGVLQWTYCMAFYLKGGKEKNLFEHQQGMLTEHTEALQELFDSDEVESLLEKRKKIIDMIGSMTKFCRQMVNHVEMGNLESVLLSDADTSISGVNWSCTTCSKENKSTQTDCKYCRACRKHGEMECRACHPR